MQNFFSLLLSTSAAPVSFQPIASPAPLPPKTKASEPPAGHPNGSHASKKGHPDRDDLHRPHPNAEQTEDFDIVLRHFYPLEMSNGRCQAYTNGELERAIVTLQKACRENVDKCRSINVGSAVVHRFKSDLRRHDSRAAYQFAKEHQVPLIGLYIDKRKAIPKQIVELCQQWGAKSLYANIEYEVDELRREAKLVRLCADNDISFTHSHDTCVVTPGALASQRGKQYSVYTPWYRSWLAFLKENPDYLEVAEGECTTTIQELVQLQCASRPNTHILSDEDQKRFEWFYPAGEHEALQRLGNFLEKGKEYEKARSKLSGESTSVLSPYFACRALSARTAVVAAKRINKGHIDRYDPGYMTCIGELARRDFYKHVLEYDNDQFQAWRDGMTGFPIVDAAMRQLRHCAWMHNRTCMLFSSFLTKDLMLDWRRGERYFIENLMDGDFASNHGGEQFDPEGEYICHWLPELRDMSGKAIRESYARGAAAIAQNNGYPRSIMDHAESRDRALERFKKALKWMLNM
ncbi:hypothetical protein N7519_010217 [Penicillium mononematosum]|uniref:uncharacterized protein n=1 Tax=Penicillium mononematosum TaxID=268346 RepID=UPI002547AA70|nr:uncharacterized protein N7519_010217 [Penicillium mononematosum]KAJ6179756.1 hypothetical protein N7519_010217 [Penicillium mononematosum]